MLGCVIAPAARESQEAGFTQPSLYLFLHVCTFPLLGTLNSNVQSRKKGLYVVGPAWLLLSKTYKPFLSPL